MNRAGLVGMILFGSPLIVAVFVWFIAGTYPAPIGATVAMAGLTWVSALAWSIR